MTTLPPPLARWARELAGLPAPLVTTLAPWLGRLAIAIGPLPGDRRADDGALDGVDGLARRGSYERLLIAEWAIADELPDEFLRRAASGEHLFVARAHRAPPHRRTSVVLLSAGPSQLGAPRLVHVAALIVMARRAAAAGAALAWGVLERPDAGLATAVDPAAIDRLLGARTATTAGAAEREAWRAAVGGDDRWVIGGDEHAADARALGAALLVVRDPLEPGAAALEVEVQLPDRPRPRAQLRLALPPAADAARLIRDAFGRAIAPRGARLAGTPRRLWFVQGGRRLAIALADRVEVWPIPSSPREPAGKPRVVRLDAGETLIALGTPRRTALAVTWRRDDPTRVRIYDGAAGPRPWTATLPDAIVARLRGGEPVARWGPGFAGPMATASGPTIAFTGPTGSMLIATREPLPLLHVVALGREVPVAGAVQLERGVAFAAVRVDRVDVMAADARGERRLAQVQRGATAADAADPGVRWGCAIPARGTWGPIAVQVGEARWEVIEGGVPAITIETPARVHGVVVRGGDARLLCTGDDGRGLILRGRLDSVPLVRTEHAVTDLVAAPSHPVVAWSTAHEVVVYSLHFHAVLLRIAHGEP